jgi:hypothetical protein
MIVVCALLDHFALGPAHKVLRFCALPSGSQRRVSGVSGPMVPLRVTRDFGRGLNYWAAETTDTALKSLTEERESRSAVA